MSAERCHRSLQTSKLDFEPRALDPSDGHPVSSAAFLEEEVAAVYAREPPGKCRLPIDRLARDHFCQPSVKSPVICFVPEWSIETRRRNLQRVRMPDGAGLECVVFHVENGAQILADALAVGNAHRIVLQPPPHRVRVSGLARLGDRDRPGTRSIDDHAQHRSGRFATQLDVKHLQPVAPRHALRRFADTLQPLSRWRKNDP